MAVGAAGAEALVVAALAVLAAAELVLLEALVTARLPDVKNSMIGAITSGLGVALAAVITQRYLGLDSAIHAHRGASDLLSFPTVFLHLEVLLEPPPAP